ncbi:MAG: hypothetical protein GF375_03055 [Candidatus Omnitrophica bacterium]|nr:hypothetical protein [Candidatus Omnitrophota bacterium]MBD3269069.1 hypothetical protein [Candidatus Omnitrophota bacterium]
MFTKNQRRYLIYWLIITAIAEGLMLFLNKNLTIIYLIIAALFLAGFTLRVLKLYPGKDEPLILDSSAVLLSLGFVRASEVLGESNLRFLLIFTSSLIIFPHLLYIIRKKDIQ